MKNLDAANLARLNKSLNNRLRFDNEVLTIKQAIELNKFSRADSFTAPKVRYNRIKFNRMNYEEQAIYEAKMKETKIVYALYIKGSSSFYEVPKLVHDYFNSITV